MPLTVASSFVRDDIPKKLLEVLEYISTRNGALTSDHDSTLCRQCRVMLHGPGILDLFSPTGFKHSPLSTFKSRENCKFCQFLWNGNIVGNTNQVHHIRRLSDLVNASSTRPPIVKEPERTWVSFRAMKEGTLKWESLEIRVESERGRLLWQPLHNLRVVVPEGNPFAEISLYRPIYWSGGMSQSHQTLSRLLSYCHENHERCPPLGPKRLPTRVLLISGEAPHLAMNIHASTVNEEGEYTALSYCWGGPQSLCLTTDNIERLLETETDIRQLPKTLRDAILVTHALGFRYLWVDALCIIQDSPVDKEHEINRMCSIYENSAITIAAATADSVHAGFLDSIRSYNPIQPSCSVQMPFQEPDGEAWGSVVFSPSQTQHTDDFPINKRGWTFQEAFIPHRLLVFGDVEPFLRCRSSDTVRLSLSATAYYYSRIEPRRVLNQGRPYNGGYIEENNERQFRSLWKYIVEQYSLRRFSLEQDRPLAIGGVVEYLTRAYEGQCYYGVWSTCPIACLLWTSHPRDREEQARVPNIPSWSWMSISSNEIDMSHLELLGNDEGEASVQFTAAPHAQLYVTCHVLPIREVCETNNIVDYWNDLGDDFPEQYYLEENSGILLIMARTSNQRLLGIEARLDREGIYRRFGIIEIRGVDNWMSMDKVSITLE